MTNERDRRHLAGGDHGRKVGLGPMRGLKTDGAARVFIHGHAVMQGLCRSLYELGKAHILLTSAR